MMAMIINGRADIWKILPGIAFVLFTIIFWPFVVKYVWYPVLADALGRPIDGVKEGYNVFNTIYLSLLFVYFAYLLYEYLRFLKVDFNKLFLFAVPIGLLGGALRALEDQGVFPYPYNILFITPFIYLLLAAYACVCLYFDRKLKLVPWITLGFVIISLFFIHFQRLELVPLIVALFFALLSISYLLVRFLSLGDDALAAFGAHMVDASATFVGLSVGYVEKHVVPRLFTGIVGPVGIIILKFAVLTPLLYLLRERNELNHFIKILILLLGLGPGFRNALRITAGV